MGAGPKNLRSVDVVLTAGCNLACSYCYQNDKQAKTRMKWGTLRRSVDLLLGSNRSELKLGFYGGEPLLQYDLIRRAVRYAEKHRRAGQVVRYAIITNGTLIREEQAEFLARHRFHTQISFDGVRAAQDRRDSRTFEVLDRLLDRLRSEHPLFFFENVHVSMTLLPQTVRYLADSIEYFVEQRVSHVRFSPQITGTPDWRVEQIEDLDRQFARVFERCVDLYHESGRVPLEVFRKEDEDECSPPRTQSVCGAPGGEALTVDLDGQASGCVMFAGSYQRFASKFMRRQIEPLRLGDIRAQDFKRRRKLYRRMASASEMFRHKESKRSSYRRCGDCRYLAQCTYCPVSIGNIPGNVDPHRVPDFICAYNLVVNKYRERFPRQTGTLDLLEGQPHVPRLMQELEAFIEHRRTARG